MQIYTNNDFVLEFSGGFIMKYFSDILILSDSKISGQPTLSNTISPIYFLDIVTYICMRNNRNYVAIQTDLTIFEIDQFNSPKVAVAPIHNHFRDYTRPDEQFCIF